MALQSPWLQRAEEEKQGDLDPHRSCFVGSCSFFFQVSIPNIQLPLEQNGIVAALNTCSPAAVFFDDHTPFNVSTSHVSAVLLVTHCIYIKSSLSQEFDHNICSRYLL